MILGEFRNAAARDAINEILVYKQSFKNPEFNS